MILALFTPTSSWEQVIYITKALYRGHLDRIGLGETVLFYIFVEDVVWTQFLLQVCVVISLLNIN